jgi:hypothetical protein
MEVRMSFFQRLRRLRQHPTLILPFWMYRVEYSRFGYRTDVITHVIFNRIRLYQF